MQRPAYRPDIDGLRAIAVLSVIAFHAFPQTVTGGFVGVDIFFVISGYLITTVILTSLQSGTFSFFEFYQRRIKRLFPALLVVLAATYVFGSATLLPEEIKQLSKHIVASAGFVSNLVFWRESGYFDAAPESKPLLHLWSLGVEEQFYIVWPLVLWLAWKKRHVLFAGILAITVMSFAMNLYELNHDAAAAFYSPQTRFWELMFGAMLSCMSVHRPEMGERPLPQPHRTTVVGLASLTPFGRDAASAVGVLLIAAGICFVTKERSFPGWWATLPTLGTVFLIWAGPGACVNRTVLSRKCLVAIGLISYPLYLWHWPLLSFPQTIDGEMPAPPFRLLIVAVSLLAAWLTYRFVEAPIRSGSRIRPGAPLLTTGMIVIALLGYFSYKYEPFGAVPRMNLGLTAAAIQEDHNRYWGNRRESNFANGRPRIIVLGDSQAVDVLTALQNDKEIGLKWFDIPWDCREFVFSDLGSDERTRQCRENFDKFLHFNELTQADILIYAHVWRRGPDTLGRYRVGLNKILERNPRLKVYFFGPKPFLGNKFIKINAIIRSHPSTTGLNKFLNSRMLDAREEIEYVRNLSEMLGATFVDVTGIFCNGECPFFINNNFSYFDQAHWTKSGAKIFYDRFTKTGFYHAMKMKTSAPEPPRWAAAPVPVAGKSE